MSTMITSTADVATKRPGRFGKQLVSHLGRRSIGVWDDDAQSGTIDFGEAVAHLSCTTENLHLEVRAQPDAIARMEDVVGRHLVRFGQKAELVARWSRSDGTTGTIQGLTSGPD